MSASDEEMRAFGSQAVQLAYRAMEEGERKGREAAMAKPVIYKGHASASVTFELTVSGGVITAKVLRNVCKMLEVNASFLDDEFVPEEPAISPEAVDAKSRDHAK